MNIKKDDSHLLECCLFFTVNSLSRIITRMGEAEFSRVGMTPSYAFLLSLSIDAPGISQKKLAELLHIAPSTVSRFVDTLITKGYIRKETAGRNTFIYPTDSGKRLEPEIKNAWHNLYERYCTILGKQQGELLTELTSAASKKLQESME